MDFKNHIALKLIFYILVKINPLGALLLLLCYSIQVIKSVVM